MDVVVPVLWTLAVQASPTRLNEEQLDYRLVVF
ncbi:hypothetical protein GMORB2_3983 [Geosmithia morbida]|uniref:Uncharacterized protein n=1 Tax=Geosmithia morbida TaxID=1094350 RepID=A0A9P4Z1X5_9HYPO|nr:uncharacterized protein GMORB2_3983 [Geosmithia morbida]KAF4125144.1 hypothetical protein GMORB2_3983 [Geosmithia morbida]